MRLSMFLILFCLILVAANTEVSGEEIPLKLNQKEVDIDGKIEKFYSLFPDPPLEIKIKGDLRLNIILRKVIDKKNPLTKLPVTVTVTLDNNKVQDVLMNDREGKATIKDATMFNAGSENVISLDIKEGEHSLKISASKSAIKGVLLRIEKVEIKKEGAIAEKSEATQKQESTIKAEQDKELVPPIVPLVPLVPQEAKKEEAKKEAEKKAIEKEKSSLPEVKVASKKETEAVTEMRHQKRMEPGIKSIHKKGFGDIVILSLKGGVILPLEYGNPGGYGEFSTSFYIYRGFLIGGSIASYKSDKGYIINDPGYGNDILKYHLHAVPVSGFVGYKTQTGDVVARVSIGAGINMVDIKLDRKNLYIPEDTINSFQLNVDLDLAYVLRYGALGAGIKYIYSRTDNSDSVNGFVKNIQSGGFAITIGYNYGF